MPESEPLAARVQRASRAALLGAACDVRVVTRVPLTVDILDVAGNPPLTAVQRAAAKVAAEAVNPAPRVPKATDALRNEIIAWMGANPDRLRQVAALALALGVQRDPTLARRHGIAVDGDQ